MYFRFCCDELLGFLTVKGCEKVCSDCIGCIGCIGRIGCIGVKGKACEYPMDKIRNEISDCRVVFIERANYTY